MGYPNNTTNLFHYIHFTNGVTDQVSLVSYQYIWYSTTTTTVFVTVTFSIFVFRFFQMIKVGYLCNFLLDASVGSKDTWYVGEKVILKRTRKKSLR